jgi:hypothetical protein
MAFNGLWQSIEAMPLADYIETSAWAFPMLESVHVIAITTVIGTIAIMDLRLLGWASRGARVTEVSNDSLRWTWGAFALAVLTGGLLFTSKAVDYVANPYFDWKMVLIALAGVNMAVFHLFAWPKVGSWDIGTIPPSAAKLAGGLSLAFWIAVVFLARVVGFTLDKFNPGG